MYCLGFFSHFPSIHYTAVALGQVACARLGLTRHLDHGTAASSSSSPNPLCSVSGLHNQSPSARSGWRHCTALFSKNSQPALLRRPPLCARSTSPGSMTASTQPTADVDGAPVSPDILCPTPPTQLLRAIRSFSRLAQRPCNFWALPHTTSYMLLLGTHALALTKVKPLQSAVLQRFHRESAGNASVTFKCSHLNLILSSINTILLNIAKFSQIHSLHTSVFFH